VSAPVLPGSGGLAEALNILLDKGLVIDATIRVSVIGIEILTIEVKVVIASVDTYIRYLEAMHRLDMARRAANGVIPPPAPKASPEHTDSSQSQWAYQSLSHRSLSHRWPCPRPHRRPQSRRRKRRHETSPQRRRPVRPPVAREQRGGRTRFTDPAGQRRW
jgi:hypothetical protein